MMRAPRKCFWKDQARALVVGSILCAVLMAVLVALRIPERIESKALHVIEQQGG